MLNNTSVPGNLLAFNGIGPAAVAYDGGQEALYVADTGTDGLTILNSTSFAYVGSIRLPASPIALAYDGHTRELFVALGQSVEVFNDSSQRLITNISIGGAPEGLAYDSGTHEVFVSNTGTGVSVISDASNRVVSNISVGFWPRGIVYDSGKAEVFVANLYSKNLSVISDATNRVATSIPLADNPVALAYDPAKSEVFVANYYGPNLTVVSDGSASVVAQIPTDSVPFVTIQFDGAKGEIFYFSHYQDLTTPPVRVYSDTTNKLVGNVSVGEAPEGAAYDRTRGVVFASNFVSDTVSVINDTYDSVNATIPVGMQPDAIGFDANTNELYVAIANLGSVSVLSAVTGRLTASIRVGEYPIGLVADPATDAVFVANQGSSSVSVISDITKKVISTISLPHSPTAIALDKSKGELFVPDTWDNVSVVSVTSRSTVATIGVGYGPHGIAYDQGRGEVFVANQGQGSGGSVSVISDSSNKQVADVKVGMYPLALAYDRQRGDIVVANSGSGSDNVSVISDRNNTLVAEFKTLSNPAALSYDEGAGKIFVADRGSGTVEALSDASGGTTPAAVGQSPAGLAYDTTNGRTYSANFDQGTISTLDLANYTVAFQEFGLPLGTSWTTTLDGAPLSANGTTIAFTESNGTYAYRVVPIPGFAPVLSAALTVDGANVTLPIRFGRDFGLSFTEHGLPTGSSWSVSVNGSRISSALPTISFEVENGTYSFDVQSLRGYRASPESGTVTVTGGNQTVLVDFFRAVYAVIFNRSGLPTNTTWTVTLNGTALSSPETSLRFQLPNGSGYAFSIAVVPGYSADPSFGIINISGSAISQSIAFLPIRVGIAVRAWANVTSQGGGGSYCLDGTGRIGTHSAWENVSFVAVAWNGSPPYRFNWSLGDGPFLFLGERVNHTYVGFGTWQANLSVVDAARATNSTHFVIRNTPPPTHPLICPKTPSTNSTFLGLPLLEGYAVVAGIAITVVAAAAALIIWRKGSTPPPVEQDPVSPPEK